jgi:hypothetical protein
MLCVFGMVVWCLHRFFLADLGVALVGAWCMGCAANVKYVCSVELVPAAAPVFCGSVGFSEVRMGAWVSVCEVVGALASVVAWWRMHFNTLLPTVSYGEAYLKSNN